MKKTILGVVVIAILLVAMLGVTVNAADLTASVQGEVITVTVKTNQEVSGMEFELKYDTEKCKYMDKVITNLSSVETDKIADDTILVSATGGEASTVSLQFEVLKKGEKIPFTINNTEFSVAGRPTTETVVNPTAEIIVSEPAPVVPTPEEPKDDEQQKPSEEGKTEVDTSKAEETKTEEGKYVDEDGKEIKKIPQTGSYIPSVAVGVIALAIVTLATIKMIKNK